MQKFSKKLGLASLLKDARIAVGAFTIAAVATGHVYSVSAQAAEFPAPEAGVAGEEHPAINEGACKGLSTVAQPTMGIDGRAQVEIESTTEIAQKGLDRITYWRQDALDNGILWEDGKKADGKTNWVTMRQYLQNHHIDEQTYLHPHWNQQAEIFSIQRALEASITQAHERMTGSDEAGKAGGIGEESLADQSHSTEQGDIIGGVDILAGEKGRWVKGTTTGVFEGETGHYKSIVNPGVTQVGLGQVHHTTILTNYGGDAPSQPFVNWKGTCEFQFIYRKATMDKFLTKPVYQGQVIPVNTDVKAVLKGNTIPPKEAAYWKSFPVSLTGKFISADPSILTANGMTLTGVKPGKTSVMFESGNEQLGPYEVEVVGSKLVSLEYPKLIETTSTNAPILPKTVIGHYADGTTKELLVQWDPNESYKPQSMWGKTYQQVGHVAEWPEPISTDIKVRDTDRWPAELVRVKTKVGVAPVMPKTGRIIGVYPYQRWGASFPAIDPAQYAQPGEFLVMGHIGSGGEFPVIVTVEPNETTSTAPTTTKAPVPTSSATPTAAVKPTPTTTSTTPQSSTTSVVPTSSATSTTTQTSVTTTTSTTSVVPTSSATSTTTQTSVTTTTSTTSVVPTSSATSTTSTTSVEPTTTTTTVEPTTSATSTSTVEPTTTVEPTSSVTTTPSAPTSTTSVEPTTTTSATTTTSTTSVEPTTTTTSTTTVEPTTSAAVAPTSVKPGESLKIKDIAFDATKDVELIVTDETGQEVKGLVAKVDPATHAIIIEQKEPVKARTLRIRLLQQSVELAAFAVAVETAEPSSVATTPAAPATATASATATPQVTTSTPQPSQKLPGDNGSSGSSASTQAGGFDYMLLVVIVPLLALLGISGAVALLGGFIPGLPALKLGNQDK